MIKQLLHIFLSGFLLLGTAGLVVSKHYSNGELYSSSLFGEAEPCCADDEMCSCCSTETEFFQVEDDFISTSFQLPVMVCLQSFISPMNEISESQKTSFLKKGLNFTGAVHAFLKSSTHFPLVFYLMKCNLPWALMLLHLARYFGIP